MPKLTKAFLILIVFLTSFSFAQHRKIVLLEEFTNASCPPCAQLNPGLQNFISTNFGTVISVRHHAWWPGNDPMYDLNVEENSARISYYNVGYVPWAQLDGVFFGEPADMDLMKKLVLSYQANGSPVKISIDNNSSPTEINTSVTIEGIENVEANNLKLYVAVIERMVEYEQAPGSNGEKEFADVMRKYLPDTDGTAIPLRKSAEPLNFNFTFPINPEWNPDNLEIVAWIQSDETKEIFQSNISIPTYVIEADHPAAELLPQNQTVVRSYSITNENDVALNLLLKTEVNTIQSGWTHGLIYDGLHSPSFNVSINPGETLNFDLEIITNDQEGEISLEVLAQNTDDPLLYSNNLSYYGVIQSGVLVWDGNTTGVDVSGQFINDVLTKLNIDVNYTSEFPLVLDGFDAIFLCFGNAGNGSGKYSKFNDDMAELVKNYLLASGKVYIEGGSILGADQTDNLELQNLLGLRASSASALINNIDLLTGNTGTAVEDMVFHSSTQKNQKWIDFYNPFETGLVAFVESDYGNVAIQNAGSHGQKSFCFSYCLAGLTDESVRSKKESLLAEILNFFGIDFPQLVVDFNVNQNSGHAPLAVEFLDGTFADPDFPISNWKWDFNNDGTIDSEEQNPVWNYESQGYYTVKLEITTPLQTLNLVEEKFVRVFNGESSIQFVGGANAVASSVGPAVKISDKFSFEAWIKPIAWSKSTESITTVADKKAFTINIVNGKPEYNPESLLLSLRAADNTVINYNTAANSISLNEWQHIAATYDGNSGTVKLYLNGNNVPVTNSGSITGNLVNNIISPLVIGNIIDHSTSFIGNIDEVRFWNTARSETDIADSFNKYLSGSEEGLIGCWSFNEGFGKDLFDASPNSNNLKSDGTEWDFGAPMNGTSGIDEEISTTLPSSFILYDNYPNPFNPSTTIKYDIPFASKVSVVIYDILGREVVKLVNKDQNSGRYSVIWNGKNNLNANVSSGVYLCKFIAESENGGNVQLSKKLLLMK
ncbi:MAG: LamG-like jellyroll fold domain-containing protein [bacterium]